MNHLVIWKRGLFKKVRRLVHVVDLPEESVVVWESLTLKVIDVLNMSHVLVILLG